MPTSPFPEGLIALSSDSEWRSLQKWGRALYDAVGNRLSPYPEGTQILVSDNEERLEKKINIMLSGSSSPVPPAPSPPANLVAVPGSTIVDLSWDASVGAVTYNVKRSLTNGGPYSLVAGSQTGLTYQDTGLDNGTTYYYIVTAVGLGGESGVSNEDDATPDYADSPDNYPGLIIWAAADDITSANGASVFPWQDRASAGFYSSCGFAPTFVEGPPKSASFGYIGGPLNEASCLQFPNSYFFIDAAPYTVIAAYAGGDFVFCGALSFNCQIRAGRAGANVLSAYDNDTEAVSSVLSSPLSSLRMLTWTRAGGVVSFYEGSTARGSSFNAGAHTMRFDVMGRNLYVSNVSAGNPSELCVYTGNIGVPAITSLYNNYFKVKYPTMA